MRTLAITLGDPAGVGPEIVARSLAEIPDFRTVVLGSGRVLERAARRAGLTLDVRRIASPDEAEAGRINLIPVSEDVVPEPGHPSPETGRAALAAIDHGLDLAMGRKIHALATAPVSKKHIVEGGVPFMGHTEYLAARSGVKDPVMFFTSAKIRVSLVTTHLPLRKVPGALTIDRILSTIAVTEEGLRKFFGVLEPRIAVSGLNPHAGEGGHVGREEIDVIGPAIEAARAKGHCASGPHPGDTIYRRMMDGHFDVVVAMYHDQALGPVKTLARDATNVTLGLPFVRTSVDHGTAFDIAGRGEADPAPMAGCIRVACEMARAVAPLV